VSAHQAELPLSERHAWTFHEVWAFDVAGQPAPQGSKSIGRFGDKAWIKEAGSKTGRANLAAWRDAVAAEARRYAEGHGPLDGPVGLVLVYRMPRTKSLLKTRYNWPTVKPDFDKLTRATCDALKGIVWRDDAQVCSAAVLKRYADPDEAPGCGVLIGTLTVGL
jgi:crossover junction endodeoxyribonuclease RusA